MKIQVCNQCELEKYFEVSLVLVIRKSVTSSGGYNNYVLVKMQVVKQQFM